MKIIALICFLLAHKGGLYEQQKCSYTLFFFMYNNLPFEYIKICLGLLHIIFGNY